MIALTTDIVMDVTGMMQSVLDGTQLNRLRVVLTQILNEYDIKEKPHEISTGEDLNEQ